MTNGKIIKTIGIAVTVIGFGVNILTDWVNEKMCIRDRSGGQRRGT